ncbi:haloacid dehalogenase-like hydrolase [Streptomyces endophytica]|uniref:phosphoserine phosphatase n=1 Tax=Streptomyces endophytica TaxID=2991496 RepID=A0ABY6PEE2_9ACTN|nr:haloacid dehalogenase-like hydrolase [Streptomyces endophytica]UZJ32205.1 haloacid dehalogenase-like hydrolase [Streptomyces endophytica]
MLTKRRWLAAGAALAVVGGGVAVAQTATAAPTPHRCPTLQVSKGWYGDNRAKLQKMIDERGSCSGAGGARPVATFDWDNTVVKNDISDATLAWMLRHDKVLRPASWKATNKWLTDAAADALTQACGTSVPAGHPLPTSTDTGCTDEILDVYSDEKTSGGKEAFEGEWNHRRTVPSYVWITQLFAGHTPRALTSYAAEARKENLAAPIGTEQTVGTHKWAGYVRYYEQQRDLIGTLQKAGFDVYIVSASAEPLVRAWAPGVGIDREHVIGIRNLVRDGKLTTGVQGCGDVKDTNGEVLTYMDGKRCWINQEIFHVKGAKAWQQQDRAHRAAFAAGDAETDVTFVGDATAGHLAINRNKTELMCRAYDNADHRWIVNPMFIEPKPRKADPYPCATAGYTRPDGTLGPIHRADGSVIPDQKDTVY